MFWFAKLAFCILIAVIMSGNRVARRQKVEKARLQLASKAALVSASLHLDYHEQERFLKDLPSPRSAGTSSGSSRRL